MLKVGILGGGQLGRMLLQAAANYPVETHVLENDDECPSAHLCRYFIKGDIKNFDAVYNFGKTLDIVTIEIENVNIDALEERNETLKNKISDYENNQTDWESFKREFNSDMSELGNALKDLTVNNKN